MGEDFVFESTSERLRAMERGNDDNLRAGSSEDPLSPSSGAVVDVPPIAFCSSLDVSKGACPSPHSLVNKIGRILWAIVWGTMFRWSPRIFFGWRRFLLRCFGATIGRNARISPSVKVWAPWNLTVGDEGAIAHEVDCYCVDRLTIGNHATVSQYSFLCTASHDIRDPHMKLITAPVEIGDQAWVCAGAFVGMGLNIGQGAVVGAMSIVTRDVPGWTVVAGNPAKTIGLRTLTSTTAPFVG